MLNLKPVAKRESPKRAPSAFWKSMSQAEKGIHPLKSINVKIDMENCGFPTSFNPASVINNIKGTLYQAGYIVHSITAFAFKDSFDAVLRESLSSLDGLQMVWVTRDDGDQRHSLADLSLKEDILQLSLTCQPPSPLLVCTSDKDFVTVLELVIKNGVEVLLAYDPNSTANELLRVEVEEAMEWPNLARGDLLPTDFTRDRPPQIHRWETSLMVLWDVPSCSLPPNVSLKKLQGNIQGVLAKEYGYGGVSQMKAYNIPANFPNKSMICKMTRKMTQGKIEFSIVDPLSPSKNKSPEQYYPHQVMKTEMYMWFLKHPEMPVLLVSNDLSFESFLQTLTDLGHEVILAHYEELPEKLSRIINEKLDWDLLAGGLQGKKMKEITKKREEGKRKREEEWRGRG